MPLQPKERKEALDKFLKENEPVGSKIFAYKDNPAYKIDVYEIPMKYLVFNRYNGRISVEIDSDDAANPGLKIPYDHDLEKKIINYLWESNPPRNKTTLADIKKKGQLEPGVVTADGVIVDGNRRAMLLTKLEPPAEFFKAGILKDAYTEDNEKSIRKLENQIQFDQDSKVDYDPLAKYLSAYKLYTEDGFSAEDIANLRGQNTTKSEVEKWINTFGLMKDYLDKHLETPNIYTLLRIGDKKGTKEEGFLQATNIFNRIKEDQITGIETPLKPVEDSRKYKRMIYDYLRAETMGAPSEYRLLGLGTDKNGLLYHKDLFDEMFEEHKKNMEATRDLPDLKTFCNDNPHLSLKEAALAREEEFKKLVAPQLHETFLKYTNLARNRRQGEKPEVQIEKVLREMKSLENKVDRLQESENVKFLKDQLLQINKIAFDISKEL